MNPGMKRIVDYDDSSSSSSSEEVRKVAKKNHFEQNRSDPQNLSPTIKKCSSDEGSSRMKNRSETQQEGESPRMKNPVETQYDHTVFQGQMKNPATLLLEMGFTPEQVMNAINACGKESPSDLLSDYCLNDQSHPSVVEGEPNNLGIELDPATQLREMGFSTEQVETAINACGKENISLLSEFIQAHFNDYEEEDKQLNVVEGEPNDLEVELEEDPATKLRDMGFSTEQVETAINACGKETISLLSEFIQAHFHDYEEENKQLNEKEDQGESADPYTDILQMGFDAEQVTQAIKACGENSSSFVLLEFIEAHYGNVAGEEKNRDDEGSSGDEEADQNPPWKRLQRMGFSPRAIERAVDALDSLNFEDLFDFLIGAKKDEPEQGMYAKQEWNEGIDVFPAQAGPSRTMESFNLASLKVQKGRKQISVSQSKGDEIFKTGSALGGKLMGFGVPGYPEIGRPKPLNPLMEGAPFFYFENVASVPNSEWDTIKRHLNGIDPEFVDSKYFSASKRPRGYVHNLPIHARKLILPTPPMTIFEALPQTKKYWPPWDTREKLNCINTRRAHDTLCSEIRHTVAEHDGIDIPLCVQKKIIEDSKKWNLVWVGPGQVAPLEPHEIELLLGYDHEHSRGVSTITDRYEALGNSFQVNTVAYHLSPLKTLYPHGVTVLSLFSGIGGAEVALHKLGVILKTVIVVEIESKSRNVITSWWKKTSQKGTLIIKEDVRDLTNEVLAQLIDHVGGIDLIIGGSPCNNLSGNNRVSRVGLMGKESSLFFEFPRILNIVKQIMQSRGYI